jgi:hypothetical protein
MDQATPNPLLDFLYADHERVASFLAQIQHAGVLRGAEETAGRGEKSTKEGGLNLGPLHGGLSGEQDWNREVRLTYDPLWSNSRKLIEHIENNATTDGTSFVGLGQLRILSGQLLAYDLSSLTSLMNSEAMDDFIAGGISDQPHMEGRSPKAKSDLKKREASVIRSFLATLNLGVGFVLVTEEQHFWFSVKREFLSLHSMDIPLKYPAHISGNWRVLGLIDAMPNDHIEGLQPVLAKGIDGLMPNMVVQMMQLIGVIVGLFGRPLPAYGLSPLVVYRQVSI